MNKTKITAEREIIASLNEDISKQEQEQAGERGENFVHFQIEPLKTAKLYKFPLARSGTIKSSKNP
jgi:hypothetical protein